MENLSIQFIVINNTITDIQKKAIEELNIPISITESDCKRLETMVNRRPQKNEQLIGVWCEEEGVDFEEVMDTKYKIIIKGVNSVGYLVTYTMPNAIFEKNSSTVARITVIDAIKKMVEA